MCLQFLVDVSYLDVASSVVDIPLGFSPSLLLPKVLPAHFSELLDRQTGLCAEQSALMKIQLANSKLRPFMQKHVLRLYCWCTSMYILKAYQSWKVPNFSLGSGAMTIHQHG
jgi:hypothetical protein